MIAFLAHVHIFDATHLLSRYGDHGGVGWGGDGMITLLAHVHIFDATHFLSCYGDHGGVGMG